MLRIKISKIFLASILIIFLMDAFYIDGVPSLQIGLYNIYPMDILSILLLFIIGFKLLFTNFRIKKFVVLALVFGLFLMTSYIRGVGLFGIEQATNSFRSYLYFYVVFLATIILWQDVNISSQVISGWAITAWVLVGLVILRWGLVASNVINNTNWLSSGGMMIRVISATQTLFLLQSIIFSLLIHQESIRMPLQNYMLFIFVPVVILLQHRTIWIIFVCILAFLLLRKKNLWPIIFGGALVLIILSGIILLIGKDSQIITSILSSIQNLGTLSWRYEGWVQLLSPERFKSNIDYLIGQPFGTGYTRYYIGSTGVGYYTNVSPHNFFIQTYLNIGGFGLLILLMIYFNTLRPLLKQNQISQPFAFGVIIISQLLFFMTYQPTYEQGILLGCALSIANSLENKVNR